MKTVIKHGYQARMHTTCPYCGCEFTYESQDIIAMPTITSHTSTNCVYSPGAYVTCPDCGAMLYISIYLPYKYPQITWTTRTVYDQSL